MRIESLAVEPLDLQLRETFHIALGTQHTAENVFDRDENRERGGGCGVSATPVGALEVTENSTQFVRFKSRKRIPLAFIAGIAVGLLWGIARSTILE